MNVDLTQLVCFLNNKETYVKIALQFAPELQSDYQIEFTKDIQVKFPNKRFFIIGDTSYGICCCDEITARHLDADIIIRIGSSCFTQNQHIPIYYLYENKDIENESISQCLNSLNEIIQENTTDQIIVFYSEKLKKNLIEKIRNEDLVKTIQFADIQNLDDSIQTNNELLYGRILPDNYAFNKECVIVYIGNDNDPIITELSLRYISMIKSLYVINSNTFQQEKICQSTSNTCLYRRFNLIEKAKSANTFGIIIGSLSIKNLNEIIANIKRTLEAKNKKHYTFLLGKLNDDKLFNFIEYIDCFIVIACPFNPAYNKKLIKPIVSPLDIKIAFDSQFQWDSSYSFDPNKINTLLTTTQNNPSSDSIDKHFNQETFDLEKKSVNEALVPIFSEMTLTTYDQRKYKGLKEEQDKPIQKITKGKRGIPIKYEDL